MAGQLGQTTLDNTSQTPLLRGVVSSQHHCSSQQKKQCNADQILLDVYRSKYGADQFGRREVLLICLQIDLEILTNLPSLRLYDAFFVFRKLLGLTR